jgi:uncharacterized membrane-anchored protein
MKAKLLCLVLALQLVWVFATVATQEARLHRAPTVLLETVPVDPRDLLRGDFVILSYKISRIPRELFQPPLTANLPPGTRVHVTLTPAGQFHEATAASLTSPTATPGTFVLTGTVEQDPWQASSSGQPVRLTYGIERYYVAEGTGNPRGKLTVEVAIGRSQAATIREVFLDGRPYREAMRDAKGRVP